MNDWCRVEGPSGCFCCYTESEKSVAHARPKPYVSRRPPSLQRDHPWESEVSAKYTTGCFAKDLLVQSLAEKTSFEVLRTCPGRTSEALAFA